jgi:2,3-dihydroxyphenylpropionate 1,2-dioxygenase
MEAGNANALLDMSGTQLDEVGNTEMLSWAVLYGIIGAQQGELIDYIPTWHHGLCMMRFLPTRARATAPTTVAQEFGGFKFENKGFQFYKHPPSEAYGLNKLLFESRHSDALRNRIINDFENVANEYDLHGQQREAAKSMINVGSGGLVSEHVGPLVEAGAHPLQALMSLHVIFSMSHQSSKPPVGSGRAH